jgi:hypothetical protein
MRPLISKHHKNWMSNLKGGKIFPPLLYSWFAVRRTHGFCLILPSDTPFLEMPLPC